MCFVWISNAVYLTNFIKCSYSKYGPWTSSIRFTLEVVRNSISRRPRLTEFRIRILTRCPGYLLESEKHWCKEQAYIIDAAVDIREIIYYLFFICFYCPPENQGLHVCGVEDKGDGEEIYDRSRNGWESKDLGAQKGPRDSRLGEAYFICFTLGG